VYQSETTSMKKFIFGIALLTSISVKAQTNVIANKSHSGDLANLESESANFGLDESMLIDSVIYIGSECIIEIRNAWGNFQSRDTICDNPYFKEHGYSYESAEKMYRGNTVLVGFKKSAKTIDNSKNWQKSNGVVWLFGLVILSSLIYVVAPRKNKV